MSTFFYPQKTPPSLRATSSINRGGAGDSSRRQGVFQALPLFIEGNRRVSEDRQRVYSLSVEREPIRDRLPGSIPRRGEGV